MNLLGPYLMIYRFINSSR